MDNHMHGRLSVPTIMNQQDSNSEMVRDPLSSNARYGNLPIVMSYNKNFLTQRQQEKVYQGRKTQGQIDKNSLNKISMPFDLAQDSLNENMKYIDISNTPQ